MMLRLALLPVVMVLAGCQQSPGAPTGPLPGDASETRPYDGISENETFHFVGTEPFWGGEVEGTVLRWSTPENQDGTPVTVRRFAGRGGLSWDGQLDGAALSLVATPGRCSDGMSDRTYPFVVTVRLGEQTLNGCGWTEARMWTDDGQAQAHGAQNASATPAALVAADLVRAEWAKAENRKRCAALAFADDGGAGGTARRANFSGGWAVAFDTAGTRSAYGVAGPGLIPADEADAASQRRRLDDQWVLMRDLPALPQPAFAGYGVEGADGYPPENRSGEGLNSLAYVRVGGQACTYNVWSRLGRAHLEHLLDNLRMVPS
ncbi:COG3650 family protein [Qipengyuania sp. YIM B01966]|uniref:COG3650 family protein n=1 Tax=Qipengyuania sp. YIM B01966 TaxID=2778646 RepID=UPI0018F7C7F8|nr:hypothetical protein [Qipengyuania sp. YIM B01966]